MAETATRARGSISPAVGRRLASIGALLCLGGAVGTALLAIVGAGVATLVVAAISVIAAVVGMWHVLSRRGLPRLIGAVVAVAGAVTFVLVVLSGDWRGLPLAIVILMVAVSSAAARHALRPRHDADAAALRVESLPGLRHPVLLLNARSGGGKAERFHLVDECRARGIDARLLQAGDDLVQLAEDAVDLGADAIGMAGGDGSQALVAGVAARRGIPFVCVPAGTRNHFALDLGLDRENVVGALDAFRDGIERRVDLARVNGRIFVNNASMGLYAKIVQSKEYRDAKLKTAARLLPDMLGPEAEPFELRFIGPDGSDYPTAHLILVSNNPYQLDHLGGRGTRERMDSGTLGVVAARIADANEAVAFVGLEAAGQVRRFQGWLEWSTARFVVDSGSPVEVGIDGEALMMQPPLEFESMPGALRVRLPRHAPGFAPAATDTPLGASTVRALLLTAVGRPAAAAGP